MKKTIIFVMLCSAALVQAFPIVTPQATAKPTTVAQLRDLVCEAHAQNKKISIAGAGQSRGNQTLSSQAIMVDTRGLNKLVNIDMVHKLVTVQAGMTWDELEHILNPLKLSVKNRQSYCDFSIGGSVGVNVHGQNIHDTMFIDTIHSLTAILADGTVTTASRTHNANLFYAIVGGYGMCAIVAEVTLSVTDDCILEQRTVLVPIEEYQKFFLENLYNNPEVHFHSARLSVNPNGLFCRVLSMTYYTADASHESADLYTLKESKSTAARVVADILRMSDFAKRIRMPIAGWLYKNYTYVSRNNALRYGIGDLQSPKGTRDCLQEYFVPCDKMHDFLAVLKSVVLEYKINLINVSIRFVKKHEQPLLSYAPSADCFAYVLYFNVPQTAQGHATLQEWTQKVIDGTLALGGRFYMPYELLESREQLHAAYPGFSTLLSVKSQVDPQGMFTNALYEKYA